MKVLNTLRNSKYSSIFLNLLAFEIRMQGIADSDMSAMTVEGQNGQDGKSTASSTTDRHFIGGVGATYQPCKACGDDKTHS